MSLPPFLVHIFVHKSIIAREQEKYKLPQAAIHAADLLRTSCMALNLPAEGNTPGQNEIIKNAY